MVVHSSAYVPHNSIIRKFIKEPADIAEVYGIEVLDFYITPNNDIQFTVKGYWDRVGRFRKNSWILEEEGGELKKIKDGQVVKSD
jgi:hypothetical protein